MKSFENIFTEITTIESKLGYRFNDKHLLALAFVHRSYLNEHRQTIKQHNERLEFLGDSVLGLLVAEYLYKYLPSTPEGELSYLRSRLVESASCVKYMQHLDLGCYILLGKGERMNDGRGRDSILADLFEALIGAIFIDGGLEAAKKFLFKNFSREIEEILKKPLRNWKAVLQDFSQKKYQQAPVYHVLSEEGPDHSKKFCILVLINQKEVGRGEGSSKKEAQQAAAENALVKLGA